MEINEILANIEYYDKTIRVKEIEEACKKREEITPHLLGILEKVLQDPHTFSQSEREFIHYAYAMYLLAHFRETSAHELIVELFSLPEEQVDDLFGDIITEDLPFLLYASCGGKLDSILALIKHPETYTLVVDSALLALHFAVADGLITKASLIEIIESLFPADRDSERDMDFLTTLLISAMTVDPHHFKGRLETLFRKKLIDLDRVGPQDLEWELQHHNDVTWQKHLDVLMHQLHEPIAQKIEWWTELDWNDNDHEPYEPDFVDLPPIIRMPTLKIPSKKKARN